MRKEIDFLTFYEAALESTESGSIQALMDITYRFTGVPILAVDIGYTVLGIAPANKTGEYTWDYLLENRGLDISHTVMEYEAGTMQSVDEKKAPYVIDWDKNAFLPKILGLIRVNGIVEGYITMQCRQGEIDDDLLRVMDIVQRACSILYRSASRETDPIRAHMKVFAVQMFSGQIKTQNDIDLWTRTTGFFPEGSYRLYAIEAGSHAPKHLLSLIKHNIGRFLPKYLSILSEDRLFVLHYGITQEQKNSSGLMHEIGAFLGALQAKCGISGYFDDLLLLEAYRFQAVSSLRAGIRDGRTLTPFYAFFLSSILNGKLFQLPPEACTLPELQRLEDYDRTHGTALVQTLICYIESLNNTTLSARALHLHRNSMLYRIEKIEQIMGISLKRKETVYPLAMSLFARGMLHIDIP